MDDRTQPIRFWEEASTLPLPVVLAMYTTTPLPVIPKTECVPSCKKQETDQRLFPFLHAMLVCIITAELFGLSMTTLGSWPMVRLVVWILLLLFWSNATACVLRRKGRSLPPQQLQLSSLAQNTTGYLQALRLSHLKEKQYAYSQDNHLSPRLSFYHRHHRVLFSPEDPSSH